MAFEKFEWECIFNEFEEENQLVSYTYRAKVIGGWLVRHEDIVTDDDGIAKRSTMSMVFIKDITHEWKALCR